MFVVLEFFCLTLLSHQHTCGLALNEKFTMCIYKMIRWTKQTTVQIVETSTVEYGRYPNFDCSKNFVARPCRTSKETSKSQTDFLQNDENRSV